jgi:hypothetical protein
MDIANTFYTKGPIRAEVVEGLNKLRYFDMGSNVYTSTVQFQRPFPIYQISNASTSKTSTSRASHSRLTNPNGNLRSCPSEHSDYYQLIQAAVFATTPHRRACPRGKTRQRRFHMASNRNKASVCWQTFVGYISYFGLERKQTLA